jgi:hypothetical protein
MSHRNGYFISKGGQDSDIDYYCFILSQTELKFKLQLHDNEQFNTPSEFVYVNNNVDYAGKVGLF